MWPWKPEPPARIADSLARRYPRIAAEWHPERNGTLTARDVYPGCGTKVWWKCSKNGAHEWEARPAARTGAGASGCPMCSGQRVSPESSLAERNPALAAQWHPTKNGKLTPSGVTAGSRQRAWWRCPRNPRHEWCQAVSVRGAGKGCPVCAVRVVTTETSLATLHPRLAREWHPTRNGALRPSVVAPGSGRRVWWRCSKHRAHEWATAIGNRARHGTGCPVCSNRKVSRATSVRAMDPQLAREWHPTKNGRLRPDDVVAGSERLVWWQCRKKPSHVWQTRVYARARRGGGCPMCSGRRLTLESSLATRNPALAAQWHPTKNGTLRARDVMPGTARRVWWRCARNPAHEWESQVVLRSRGSGCPYCAGNRTSRESSLLGRFPKIAREWHPTKNGVLRPETIAGYSPKRVWWRCATVPSHEWQAIVSSRTWYGVGCPGCRGTRRRRKRPSRMRVPILAR